MLRKEYVLLKLIFSFGNAVELIVAIVALLQSLSSSKSTLILR